MLGYAVISSFLSFFAYVAVARPSGHGFARARLVALSFNTGSLACASLLFFIQPPWKEFSVISAPGIHGKAVIIAFVLQVFIDIGPKPCGLAFLAVAISRASVLKAVYSRFGREDYVGLAALEHQASEEQRSAETMKKVLLLTEAIKADQAWIESMQKRSFDSEEEAEKAAQVANEKQELNRSRAREAKALLFQSGIS
jgi:hypothetical protein